jgi:hypothetical protein
MEEWMYISTFSWPRQLNDPAALPPRKEPPYPFSRGLGGPQSQSGRLGEKKIAHSTGTRTPTPVAQLVATTYTDYASPAHVPGENEEKYEIPT